MDYLSSPVVSYYTPMLVGLGVGDRKECGKGVLVCYAGIPFCLLWGFSYPRISNANGGVRAHTRLQRPREVKLGHVGD